MHQPKRPDPQVAQEILGTCLAAVAPSCHQSMRNLAQTVVDKASWLVSKRQSYESEDAIAEALAGVLEVFSTDDETTPDIAILFKAAVRGLFTIYGVDIALLKPTVEEIGWNRQDHFEKIFALIGPDFFQSTTG